MSRPWAIAAPPNNPLVRGRRHLTLGLKKPEAIVWHLGMARAKEINLTGLASSTDCRGIGMTEYPRPSQSMATTACVVSESLMTETWRDGNIISFRSRVAERDIVILANGRAVVSAS